MIKVYKKLTDDQIKRGVIFSSCLSISRTESLKDTIHEVFKIDESLYKDKPTYELKEVLEENRETIRRLKDDKFFNHSHFKFNIIRR